MGIWQIWPPDGPKSGPIFFIVVPKFTPRKSDRKGVRNAGVWNFHDIWAFRGPDLVKIGHFDRKKNGDFFKTANLHQF